MESGTDFERLSQLQEEIIGFTWRQVGNNVDRFYIQGKISDDASGNIAQYSGNLKYSIVEGKVVNNSDVLTKDKLRENSDYIKHRIVQLHDLLVALQGKSPVRFRWTVDTKTGQVESDWTYYDDLTDEEKKDDFWESWKSDFAWKARLEAELAGQ